LQDSIAIALRPVFLAPDYNFFRTIVRLQQHFYRRNSAPAGNKNRNQTWLPEAKCTTQYRGGTF
jgi:hypothetical protein